MGFYSHIIMTLEDLCLKMEMFRPGCCRDFMGCRVHIFSFLLSSDSCSDHQEQHYRGFVVRSNRDVINSTSDHTHHLKTCYSSHK